MKNVSEWAENTTKKVITSKAASKELKEIFETTTDDQFLYSLFGKCETIEEMEKIRKESLTD